MNIFTTLSYFQFTTDLGRTKQNKAKQTNKKGKLYFRSFFSFSFFSFFFDACKIVIKKSPQQEAY